MMLERLRTTLAALSLTAIDARLETLLESASKKEPAYADFLLEVMSAEADARRQRYLKTRLQLAHLPYVKTFDQFDFAFQPSIDERQIRELRTLRFVHEASNVILLGPPGVGKSHAPGFESNATLATWRWAGKVFHRVIESTPFGKNVQRKSRGSAPLARTCAVDRNFLGEIKPIMWRS